MKRRRRSNNKYQQLGASKKNFKINTHQYLFNDDGGEHGRTQWAAYFNDKPDLYARLNERAVVTVEEIEQKYKTISTQ